jgi:carbon starvation protein CstA
MFEAVFILSAVDTGTRVGRFLLQEILGKYIPKFKQENWVPGVVISGALWCWINTGMQYKRKLRNDTINAGYSCHCRSSIGA